MTKLAFVGRMCCGKTTAVNYFNLYNIPFAKGVKDVAYQLGWDGKKDKKGRKVLQLIGTDIGRVLSPDIWVDKWFRDYTHYQNEVVKYKFSDQYIMSDIYFDPKNGVGNDDCRFNNEAKELKDNGFTIIHITRPRPFIWWIKEIFSLRILRHFHASERGIDKKYIDYYITARNMTELKSELDKLKEKLK